MGEGTILLAGMAAGAVIGAVLGYALAFQTARETIAALENEIDMLAQRCSPPVARPQNNGARDD